MKRLSWKLCIHEKNPEKGAGNCLFGWKAILRHLLVIQEHPHHTKTNVASKTGSWRSGLARDIEMGKVLHVSVVMTFARRRNMFL